MSVNSTMSGRSSPGHANPPAPVVATPARARAPAARKPIGYCVSRGDDFYVKCIENSSLADNTKRTHMFSIKRIQKIIPNKKICEIITTPEESFKALEDNIESRSSLKTVLGAMLAIFKHSEIKATYPDLFLRWYELIGPVAAEEIKQQQSNIPSDKQEAARVEWDNVEAVLNTLSRKDHGSRLHVMLAMYSLLPPRRQEDYFQVYVYQDASDTRPKEDHHAYIDLTISKPIVHVKDYKTSDVMKPWSKELPPRLLNIIRKSLEKTPRQYLITRKNGEPYAIVNSYTQFTDRAFKEWFGEAASLNSLRHAFSTKIAKGMISVWDHKQLARDMGHSQVTNMTYAFHTPPKQEVKVTKLK